MRNGDVRRGAIAVALAIIVSFAAASSASAASATFWGPVGAYSNPNGATSAITSLTCSSRGNCVGVGSQTNSTSGTSIYQGFVAVESGGAWSAPVTIATPPASPASYSTVDLELVSVACQSATSCVAVGQYENSNQGFAPLVVPISISGATATPGAAVSPTPPTTPDVAIDPASMASNAYFTGVSCTATGCSAVGGYDALGPGKILPMTATGSATTAWTTSEATLPSAGSTTYGGQLNAVSCPATGACEAVGVYDDSSSKLQPWALQLSSGSVGQAITFPSDFVPATEDSAGIPGVYLGVLAAISCPAAGVCTAAGSYPLTGSDATAAVAVPISAGTPQTAVKLTVGGGPTAPGVFNVNSVGAIWCGDAGDCAVTGFGAATSGFPSVVIGSETGGTWAPLSALPDPANTFESLGTALSCVDVQDCTASVANVSASASATTATPGFALSAPTLAVSTTTLPAATVGKPYTTTLQTSGGVSGDKPSWATTLGALPAGLSLNAATGVISGTPTTAAQNGVIFTATDSGPPAQSVSTSLSITVAPATAVAVPTVSLAYAAASGSKATLVLTCSGAPCAGAIGLTATEHLKGTTPTAVTAAAGKHKKKKTGGKAKTKKITLATGRYSITAGGSQTVTLTLNGSAAKLLKRLHKLAGTLTLTPTGATKPAVIKTVKFTAAPKTKQPKTTKTAREAVR